MQLQRSVSMFWDELVGLWSLCGQRWCVGGDFNVTRFLSEQSGNNNITKSMRLFDDLIRYLSLTDRLSIMRNSLGLILETLPSIGTRPFCTL